MRVCPTNVLQPSGLGHGWEALWTPVLDNRIGTSGCQLACVACGHACPTGAIRPLSLEEKHGTGAFAAAGPVRIGLAFVDQGRCLPWSMERPCIVCEENCPVTPKAIHVSEVVQTVRGGVLTVTQSGGTRLWVQGAAPLVPDRYGSGDYTCRLPGVEPVIPIVGNTVNSLILAHAPQGDEWPAPGTRIEVQVRLQRPAVDPERCIGCGVCEHECPVGGLRAIRVTAENESRGPDRSLLPGLP
jgi:NAD-dependent dihydropyrimidine dehydrogenase PreA subunit